MLFVLIFALFCSSFHNVQFEHYKTQLTLFTWLACGSCGPHHPTLITISSACAEFQFHHNLIVGTLLPDWLTDWLTTDLLTDSRADEPSKSCEFSAAFSMLICGWLLLNTFAISRYPRWWREKGFCIAAPHYYCFEGRCRNSSHLFRQINAIAGEVRYCSFCKR